MDGGKRKAERLLPNVSAVRLIPISQATFRSARDCFLNDQFRTCLRCAEPYLDLSYCGALPSSKQHRLRY